MRLKVAIAEKYPSVSVMLREYKDINEFDIVGVVDNGIELSSLIENKVPDIVITEIELLGISGLDIVGKYKNKCLRMDFIVISEAENFQDAYQAIKVGVSDFLVKPITHKKLHVAFRQAVVREISRIAHVHDNDFALRGYYTSNLASVLDDGMGIEATNINYGTRYKPGRFRCVFVKLDCATGMEWFSNSSVYMEKIKSVFFEQFAFLCHELLFEQKFDGILVVLNYDATASCEIHTRLEKIQMMVEMLFNSLYEIKITLCVGSEEDTLYGLKDSRRHAFEALWARMVIGTGNVIFWEKPEDDIPDRYKKELNRIKEHFEMACDQLNAEEIECCIHSLFSLPKKILGRAEIRRFVQNMTETFFERNKELLSIMVEGGSRIEFSSHLKLQTTLADYEQTYIRLMTRIFRWIDQNANYGGLLARKVSDYVAQNYNTKISLADIAQEMALSPAYFSTVYKNLTGKNFSEYLTEYRINVAKDLLVNSRLNVTEISNEISYQDPHYFARVFRQNVGVTPSEYRKNMQKYSK